MFLKVNSQNRPISLKTNNRFDFFLKKKDSFNLGITMNDAVTYEHITLWKLEKFNFTKKIRQINYLVVSIVKVKCYFHEVFAKNE